MDNQYQDDLDSQTLLNQARQQARAALGAERIKALHQQDWRLDLLAVALVVPVAIINGALLWTRSPDLYTPFGLIIQGWRDLRRKMSKARSKSIGARVRLPITRVRQQMPHGTWPSRA